MIGWINKNIRAARAARTLVCWKTKLWHLRSQTGKHQALIFYFSLAVAYFTFIVEAEQDGIKSAKLSWLEQKNYCGVSFPQPPPSMLKFPFVIMIVRMIENIWTYGIKRPHKLIRDCLFFKWLRIHLKNTCWFARISNKADWVCLRLFFVVPKIYLQVTQTRMAKEQKWTAAN